MPVLIVFGFLAGIVTILSPCILPVLPIVLAGSAEGGKARPWGILIGFVLSFTTVTLSLASLIQITGISPDFLRIIAVILLGIFGIILIVPQFQKRFELLASSLSARLQNRRESVKTKQRQGFVGGLTVGISLGIIWTPCVGPIMASVITLASLGSITINTITVTFAYSVGTGIPMLLIMYGGRSLFQRLRRKGRTLPRLQQVFGLIILITAFGILFNVDRNIQSAILDRFPGYADFITGIEENTQVENALENLE